MYTFERSNRSEMVRRITEKGLFCTPVPIFGENSGDKTYAMFFGRLRALFGEPNSTSASFENMYRYDIRATDGEGRMIYLGIAHTGKPYISIPADNKGVDTRPYKAARKELIMLIMRTKPADYEWRGMTDDLSEDIIYRVSGGTASFEKR